MKANLKILMIGILIIVIASFMISHYKSECEDKNGVYLRGALGYECVKVEKA